ncbi:hypothetical protein [Fibrella aquatilis]|uniref:Lipoprotein n=1 Tax=Fibrella aquatilis TaxID=2817059 RepID=A0A939G0L8_9BACT|nr:hypothetical protein [Fibrella aquatilis]MBO0929749.1 hypothetical protein [Fibrella aquatilis]
MFENKLPTAALLLTLLGSTLTGCGTKDKTTTTTQKTTATAEGPSNSASASGVDAAIDDYEKMAVEYKDLMVNVKKGDTKAMQQMQTFSQKMMAASKKIQEQAQSQGMTLTAEQQARLKKVGESFNQAAQ